MPSPALFNTLQNLVIDKYPSIIGIQIRDLFTPEARTKGRLRLKELNEVYLALVQLLVQIALADLWEATLQSNCTPRADFFIREDYRRDIRLYLYQNRATASQCDYIWLVATVQRILEENEASPFLSEIGSVSKLLQTDKKSYSAYRFLEQGLRQRLIRQDIHAREVIDLCLEAEKQLGVLLKTCGFLSAYEFVSVKEIAVRKRRRRPEPAFVHEKAVLRGRDLNTIDNLPLPRPQFTDDRTLLVTRNLADHTGKILSLSPFLIDLNAFSLKGHSLPKLYAFHHHEDDGNVVLQNTEVMEDFFTISSHYNRNEYKDLEILLELFQEFAQDLKL